MSTPTAPTQEQRDQAARLGRLAGRAQRPATDCPHDPAGTPTDRVLAAVWMRGYLKTHPTAAKSVDYDG